MNIDIELVNRALEKAGEEPLSENDIEKNSARYRLIKSYYLPTILETLHTTDWTSQKKRAKLELIEEENYTDYLFMYALPIDCAKPESIKDNEEFIIEGSRLYTNQDNAILMYISNGRIPTKKITEELKLIETTEEEKYKYKLPTFYVEIYGLESGEDFEIEEDTLITIDAKAKLEYESNADWKNEEDYPEYRTFNFDPLLSEYLETRLASKIVLKITGKTDLFQLLYNEALLMEKRASESSLVHGRSKQNGELFWGEVLGLSEDGLC